MPRSYSRRGAKSGESARNGAQMWQVVQACSAVVRAARAAGDGAQILAELGISATTLRRLLEAPTNGGWTLARLTALIAYEASTGGTTIRDALCNVPAAPAPAGDPVAVYPGLVNLLGRQGRVSQVAAEALAGGRVTPVDAARVRDELGQLIAFARDRLLPDLHALIRTTP